MSTRQESIDPVPDIRADGADGSITVSPGETVGISVSIDPGSHSRENADWWVAKSGPDGSYQYFDLIAGTMIQGLSPTYQGPLFSLGATPLLNTSNLTTGTHTFYFGVDMKMNGSLDMDSIYFDWVSINVTGP